VRLSDLRNSSAQTLRKVVRTREMGLTKPGEKKRTQKRWMPLSAHRMSPRTHFRTHVSAAEKEWTAVYICLEIAVTGKLFCVRVGRPWLQFVLHYYSVLLPVERLFVTGWVLEIKI
jgi:hypothetical protein